MAIPDKDIIDVSPTRLNRSESLFIPNIIKGLGTTLRHALQNIGRNGSNKDTLGNQTNQATPPTGAFHQISAGGYHTCGVRTDGTLSCWGKDQVANPPPSGTFRQVAAFDSPRNCAIRTDGSVTCWITTATPPAGTFW